MADAASHAGPALSVDLGRGELTTGGSRLLAVPLQTFIALARAVEATSDVALYGAGREWGEAVGRELAEAIQAATGGPARDAPPARVLDHLSGQLGALGWGVVSMEVWGEALVFVVRNAPDGAARHVLAGFFAGVAGGFARASFAGASIGAGPEVRVLVGNPAAIKAARRWHEGGAGVGAIVDRLRAGDHRKDAQ